MNKTLQGDAAIVADSMDDDCTWQEPLAALKAKFTVVSSLDVMMGNLYGIKQDNNSLSQFAINIEKVLGSIRVSHPITFSTRESQRHLRNRFFHGLNDKLRNSLRHKYETDCSCEELLQYARMVESEKIESGVSESVPAEATKAKASSAQQQQSQQPQQKGNGDLVRLEKAYKSCQGELATMQKHLQQMQTIKTSWDASAFQSSTETTPRQNGGSGRNSNAEVRNHLQEMLKLGAIRRYCSPWASAIVLERKKNGKLRFCIDLRKLNSKTLKDSCALLRIEQTLESLADSMVFSTLDLTSGC